MRRADPRYGWKPFLRGVVMFAVTIFLVVLLRRWVPLPAAGAASVFVTTVALYYVSPRPPDSFAGWLRTRLVLSALMGVGFYLISFIGGADNIPTL